MLDPYALRAAFPELDSLEFLAESGQKYVFRAQKDGRSVVLKTSVQTRIKSESTERSTPSPSSAATMSPSSSNRGKGRSVTRPGPSS